MRSELDSFDCPKCFGPNSEPIFLFFFLKVQNTMNGMTSQSKLVRKNSIPDSSPRKIVLMEILVKKEEATSSVFKSWLVEKNLN